MKKVLLCFTLTICLIFLNGCSVIYKENNSGNYQVNNKTNSVIINGVQYNKTDIAFSYCDNPLFYEKIVFFNYKGYSWLLENEIVMLEENYGHTYFYIKDESIIDDLLIDYIIIFNNGENKYIVNDNRLEEYDDSKSFEKVTLKSILDQDYYTGTFSKEDKYLDAVFHFSNDVQIMVDIYLIDNEYYFDYYSENLRLSKHKLRKINIEFE